MPAALPRRVTCRDVNRIAAGGAANQLLAGRDASLAAE
jgi:hypothetical protein